MVSEIVPFEFHGDELLLVDVDGAPHIVLKPAVEKLGLDYSTQYTKLRARSWAVIGQSPTTGRDGKTYQMVTVHVRSFLMLLATIDEHRVAKDVAPKLKLYQAEVADAVEAYWTRGGAVNPRATSEQLDRIVALSTAQLGMLRAAQGLVDSAHLEAKTRIVLARGLGEAPQLDESTTPLYVQTYLEERGLPRKRVQSIAPMFGKRAKALYEDWHGATPGRYPLTTASGQVRQVFAYTENDRPLLDAVWDQFYREQTS